LQTDFQGREFESIYTNHRYTPRELDVLSSHDSFDYLPGHSTVYRQWLQRQPARLDWDRWLMMGLIGTTVGLVGFLLHQITHLVSDIKWHRTELLIQVGIVSAPDFRRASSRPTSRHADGPSTVRPLSEQPSM
jgi:hypothetical protein